MSRQSVVFALSLLAILSCARAPSESASDLAGRIDAGANQALESKVANPAPRSFGGAVALSEVAAPSADQSAVDPVKAVADRRMIIRTGQISIKVDSLEIAIRQVGELAISFGGYLANTSIQTGENSPRAATLEVKVPADRYQGAFDRLNGIGKVTAATTSAQDVGEEFVDVSARVANAKRLEARIIELLATRTGKLTDVLQAERELARVREEIERYEGRMRWLSTQASMSTLSINVFEPGPLVGPVGENVIVHAFKEAWRNLVSVAAAGIVLAGGLIPIAVAALIFGLLGRGLWRRSHRPAPSATA